MKQPRQTPLDLYIEQKKAEKRAAVKSYEEADQLIERLSIEIMALEQARGAINAATQKPQRAKANLAKGNGEPSETRRGRSLSEPWKKVLHRIGLKYLVSIDEIAAFCAAEGIALKRPTLRAQMSNYVRKNGYLASPSRGTFKLTDKGKEIASSVKLNADDEGRKEAGTPR